MGLQKIHVLQILGEAAGGIRKHVHSLLAGLDRSCFRVSYAYSSLWLDMGLVAEIEILTQSLEGSMALPIHKRPHVADIHNLWRLWRYVRETGVDVLHGHGAMAGVYARLLGRLTGVKVVYTPHGGAAHRMFSKSEDFLHLIVERALVSSTDHYVLESQYTADALFKKIGKTPENWTINYNGIEETDFDHCIAADSSINERQHYGRTIRIGVFGLLRKQKGQAVALRAVAPLMRNGHPISLHFFGDGPDREMLVDLARDLGLTDGVYFYGWVSPSEPYMAGMDLIVIPSLFESFGYVAVEAMMLGKPIIASATGGLREVLTKEISVMTPCGDVEALRKAIADYLSDPGCLNAMGRHGIARVKERFSLGAMLTGVETVYRQAVKRC